MKRKYYYRINNGNATLTINDGEKVDHIGKFKTDAEAKRACDYHHERACVLAQRFNRPHPEKHFI